MQLVSTLLLAASLATVIPLFLTLNGVLEDGVPASVTVDSSGLKVRRVMHAKAMCVLA